MSLHVLTGAPGSGKTTVAGPLRERLSGTVVVDQDDFLDPAGALARADLRTAAEHWPAYRALCLRLVDAVLDSAVECLLLSPLAPHELPRPGVAWAVLDCPDEVRSVRLAARPMDAAGIGAALDDARELRSLGMPVLSSAGTVPDTAAAIARWVRGFPPSGR